MSTPRIRGMRSPLALALLMAGIAANHVHLAMAPDDLAILANALHAGADFHLGPLGAEILEITIVGKQSRGLKGNSRVWSPFCTPRQVPHSCSEIRWLVSS